MPDRLHVIGDVWKSLAQQPLDLGQLSHNAAEVVRLSKIPRFQGFAQYCPSSNYNTLRLPY